MLKQLPIVLIIFLILCMAKSTFACTCDLPDQGSSIRKQVLRARAQARAIFVGKVISIESPAGALYERITLEVRNTWKGADVSKITIVTGLGGGDCGYNFELGASYLVYATGSNDNDLSTNICQRTAVYQKDLVDLKYLGTQLKHKANRPSRPTTRIVDF